MSRFITFVLHALPLSLCLWFGRGIGAITFHVLRIRRRIVLDNLARAFPEKTGRERVEIARRTYLNLGMLVVEFLRSPRMTADEVHEIFEIEGWEHADRALEQGRGLIVVTAHFGNWEMLAVACAIIGLPLHVITRKLSQRKINAYWKESRARAGLHEIPDRASVRKVLEVLRKNEVLGVVIDQNMQPPRGIFVPFFGTPAATLTVPAVMAERTGAPIVTAFAVRTHGGHHRLVVEPYEYEPVGADRAERIRHNTAKLNGILEDWIRRYPDHWLWLHRRWKTRPPDETAGEGGARNRAA